MRYERKGILLALFALPLVMGCENIAGPVAGIRDQTGAVQNKQYVSDLRRVEFTSPVEGTLMFTGDEMQLSWTVKELHPEFVVDLEVSTDNGRTFQAFATELPRATSFFWQNSLLAQGPVIFRIHATDIEGTVTDDVVLGTRLERQPPPPSYRGPKGGNQI